MTVLLIGQQLIYPNMNEKEGNQDCILATWPYFQVTETLAHQALGKIPLQNIILTTLRIYLNVNPLTTCSITYFFILLLWYDPLVLLCTMHARLPVAT